VDEDAFRELAGKGDDFLVLEGNRAVGEGEERVVGALFDVLAGVKLGAALTDDDLARADGFAAEALDAEALGNGIATELGRAAGFTMGHRKKIGITGEGYRFFSPLSMARFPP
jgi:hypothetical protein